MSLATNIAFSTEIKHDPQPEEAGTVIINVNISGGVDNLTFTTTSFIEEFLNQENYDDCQSKQDLADFLMDARLNDDEICDAVYNLFRVVFEVTFDVRRSEGLQRISLEVGMDIRFSKPDDSQIQEAVQASFNETNNIRFRPASKLVVKSLTRKIYDKSNSLDGDKCTICLEEFNKGTRVVILPCRHVFDDECIGKWFETSHFCPMRRFELPCED